MKTKSLKILSLSLLMVFSCTKEDDFLEPNPQEEALTVSTKNLSAKTIIGKKLENPYALGTMRRAWENLNRANSKSKSLKINTKQIQATHKYIKFMPKNDAELDLLKADSELILYDYPLDYEVISLGDAYHDPRVPRDQPTYQYASVPVHKVLPKNIAYEVITSLFIPDEDEEVIAKSKQNSTVSKIADNGFTDNLVDEALKLTHNLSEESITTSKNQKLFRRRSKWRPAGRIRVWDDNLGSTTTTRRIFSHWEYYNCGGGNGDPIQEFRDHEPQEELRLIPIEDHRCRRPVYRTVTETTGGSYVPVIGVKVRARRWFTTHTGITNTQGRYSCNGRFRRRANYSIIWERHNFVIRKSWLGRAKYNGPKRKGDWNLDIRGGAQEFYATIFRGAHHYYYENILGLRRPPENSLFRTKLKIRAYDEANNEVNGTHNPGRRFLGLGSAIKMYNPQNSSRTIYATTIHELAHASHWAMDRSNYRNGDKICLESWARGVETALVRIRYTGYTPSYSRLRYTGIVRDLLDGNKTTVSNFFYTDNDPWVRLRRTYLDRVGGYSIRQIEDALRGQKRWNGWRDNIRNRYTNGTENNLNAAFAHWNLQ